MLSRSSLFSSLEGRLLVITLVENRIWSKLKVNGLRYVWLTRPAVAAERQNAGLSLWYSPPNLAADAE